MDLELVQILNFKDYYLKREKSSISITLSK